ncbi:peptide-methionine (R)-S-oxide reductase MsrB [Candidatus Uhrbacteria bacterium]|jgi:peptide-methionine (R)-S-oxide reductase|nr:peptide-methionine (R)-S-oxide reductase MsrB [Candidatus Uhrbacteria bacterium]
MQSFTEDQWKEKLSPKQYNVLRKKGTEQAFTGKYYKYKESGVYHCAGCDAPLFSSESKFDSGSGWPSFDRMIKEGSLRFVDDDSGGLKRTEIVCANCNGHLGHLFEDGPTQTCNRFCVNSASLDFKHLSK